MACTLKHCKRVRNPTSLNVTHTTPPPASAPRARLRTPPARPDGRACAGSPPLRALSSTHSRPAAAAAASHARRADTRCAQRSRCRAAIADAPRPTRT
eukprot:4242241-Prymnesium_polylepis.1